MKYKIKIEPAALADIQDIIDWYNAKKPGLGRRFHDSTIKIINGLHKNPHIYAIRYKEIRCTVIRKFPYMVHFYINNETGTVEILAIFSTDRDPNIWKKRIYK